MNLLQKIRGNSLLKTGASYSIASTCSAICAMIVGFLNMRWLGPELLGIWQSVTIINLYLPIIQLGIQSGLNLELPLLLGANEKNKAMQFVSTALTFALLLAGFFTVIAIVAISIVAANSANVKVVLGIAAISVITILSCFRLHYIATYRSANAFDRLSKIYWVDCFVTLILIIFIYKYHYFGLLIFNIIKELVFTLFMYIFAPYRHIKPKFYKAHFIVLLKRGIFMTLFNEIKGIIESMPRLILLKLGGVIQVGLFNPALVVGSFMNLIPNQIAQFLHPQLGYKYGQTKQARDNWGYLKALFIYVPLCLIPVAAIGWWLIPYMLQYLFPKYLASLWPIRIILVGFLFSTTFFSRGFMITIKAYKQVLVLQSVDLLFTLLPVLAVHYFPENMLIALSIGLSISYIVTYFINIIVVRHTLFLERYNLPQ